MAEKVKELLPVNLVKEQHLDVTPVNRRMLEEALPVQVLVLIHHVTLVLLVLVAVGKLEVLELLTPEVVAEV